ncbi:MAG: TIGR03016 family PEP-CTERM system-associated outer membrane protein [Gammaproteobacteria bacterium]
MKALQNSLPVAIQIVHRVARPRTLWLVALFACPCPAGDWRFSPNVELDETYTDNVFLAPRAGARDDFVTQLTPGFALRGNGRRLQFNLDYRLQNLYYANASQLATTHQQMRTAASAELIEHSVFLILRSTTRQEVISAQNAVSLDNFANAENISDVTTTELSPQFRYRLGSRAHGEFRYSLEDLRHDNRSVISSKARVATAVLDSRSDTTRWPWHFAYQHYAIDYDTDTTTTLENALGELRYLATRQLAFAARVGHESNVTRSATNALQQGGQFWNAGVIWRPGQRTSIEGAIGRHYFGKTFSGSIRQRWRHFDWHADYLNDVFASQQVQFTNLIDSADASCLGSSATSLTANAPLSTFTGLAGLGATPEFSLLGMDLFPVRSDKTFQRQCLRTSVTMTKGKNNISVGYFRERRHFDSSDQAEEALGSSASWDWRIATRMHSVLSGGWQRSRFAGDNSGNDFRYAGIALLRQLQPDLTGSLGYRHTLRDATSGPDTKAYSENIVTLQLRLSWH